MGGPTAQSTGDVLVIEDDEEALGLVREALEREGIPCRAARDAHEGLRALEDGTYAAVILDLDLPGGDGIDVLTQLRRHSNVPVIVVSGRIALDDRVGALRLGADDYLVKPFSPLELGARMTAMLRRASNTHVPTEVRVGDLTLLPATRQAVVAGAEVSLTAREFDLLSYLARHPKTAFSRTDLLREVWDSSPEWQTEATVTEHVRRVRAKLTKAGLPDAIRTNRGTGYMIADQLRAEPTGAARSDRRVGRDS